MLTDERRQEWGVPDYNADHVAAVVEWFDAGRQVYASLVNQEELDDLARDFGLVCTTCGDDGGARESGAVCPGCDA